MQISFENNIHVSIMVLFIELAYKYFQNRNGYIFWGFEDWKSITLESGLHMYSV